MCLSLLLTLSAFASSGGNGPCSEVKLRKSYNVFLPDYEDSVLSIELDSNRKKTNRKIWVTNKKAKNSRSLAMRMGGLEELTKIETIKKVESGDECLIEIQFEGYDEELVEIDINAPKATYIKILDGYGKTSLILEAKKNIFNLLL